MVGRGELGDVRRRMLNVYDRLSKLPSLAAVERKRKCQQATNGQLLLPQEGASHSASHQVRMEAGVG